MPDLVGTCPKDFWEEWIAEGDAAGDPVTGEEWGWYTGHHLAGTMKPGDRFYVVAHGKLRGWAPVTRIERPESGFVICREGGAVACTIAEPIPGFRGLRVRWWNREDEIEFPNLESCEPMSAEERGKKERTEIQQEIIDLIRFYEKRGSDWTMPAEFTLARYSGNLEKIIRPRKGR